ncbi:MAG: SDR family NAD(P)-dependent oxidoreductase [Pseudomonadota bacterium]
MKDIVITGASRGIGRALALAIAQGSSGPLRLVLTARDEASLRDVASQVEAAGASALSIAGDLSTLAGSRALGEALAATLQAPATLVHNAGLWPSRRVLTEDGLETAFVVNCVGPVVMQQVLLARQLVDRILVVGAGLMVKGRYSTERTPTGQDFSAWRTYCTTKLAFAVAEREVAAQHPELDVVVLHPGVVRTDLGARRGPLGWLLRLAKRRFESPEVCAARLKGVLERERWSPPGQARWLFEDTEQPWPEVAEDERTRQSIREMMAAYLATPPGAHAQA